MSISIVIPTHRNIKDVKDILLKFDDQDTKCIKEVIIVFDGALAPGVFDKVAYKSFKYPVRTIQTGKRSGASSARNLGVKHASGDVILFLDSDVVPEQGLVHEHNKLHKAKRGDGIQGVAGVTCFKSNGNNFLSKCVLLCSLLYPFYQAKKGKKIYWAPTSNLSFKKSAINANPFDNRFPMLGGGEDIFMCMKTIGEKGKILGNPSAIVYHNVWDGFINISRRFFRWGLADSILIKICNEQKIGNIRFRFPSVGFYTIILLLAATIKVIVTNALKWLSILPLFLFLSLTGITIWKFVRRKKTGNPSFIHLLISTFFLYIYDFGCVFGRLKTSFPLFFKEVKLFPLDMDIYRIARIRSFFLNTFLFIAIVVLLFGFFQ